MKDRTPVSLLRIPILRALLLVLLAPACAEAPPGGLAPIPDAEFERLSLELSEEPGYFDTDNLISNETSYQHVIPKLLERAGKGGAYIGVGPDQNFTYIAGLQPQVAFVVDIRRDNLLELLFFKQLFDMADTPAQYLSRLLGRPLPVGNFSSELEPDNFLTLINQFAETPSDPIFFRDSFEKAWNSMRRRFPSLVADSDRPTLERMARSFAMGGLDLKFTSYGRPPRSIYPTLRRLLTETDLEGHHHNFLSSPRRYDVVRRMQAENRIIPVVGDLAGDKAIKRIGDYLRRNGLNVTAFYTSNVEFYLFANQVFPRFAENVRALPISSRSLFIRSYFSYWRDPHPESVPGYYVTSLLQPIGRFLETDSRRPFRSYSELIWKDYVPVVTEGAPSRLFWNRLRDAKGRPAA